MEPFDRLPKRLLRPIRFVLTDVDDTLTEGPRLPAAAYAAIERLQQAGIAVIPVTAAPAGWCELMARMWPVAAVIGENGGLCFHRDAPAGETARHYWLDREDREAVLLRLRLLGYDIAAALPAAEIAQDQRYRETTLAFRHRDPALSDAIAARMEHAGTRTTQNSLWVLGWFGEFDKLAMARRILAELFGLDIDRDAEAVLYVGDSLNDAPMFGFFPNSVGVATVRHYADRLPALPRWITRGGGGAGFVEVADRLLASPGG
jgi:HAD superfamily hydrolase (TIGR01484 family)